MPWQLQVVDFTGSCCVGGQDAGGLCCPLPSTVDEFGVCGGKSNSGISILNLKLSSNHTSGTFVPFHYRRLQICSLVPS